MSRRDSRRDDGACLGHPAYAFFRAALVSMGDAATYRPV